MKVINTGNVFNLYGDNLKVHDKLPAQCYTVRFSKDSGFYLEKHSDIEIKEDKIYGVHVQKVDKVLRSYKNFNRNLGVILSGDKGIGKSLFAKMLSIKAIQNGLPLIIVEQYIPGIASYIESIEQEVCVLFDEFDKTFGNTCKSDDEEETMEQASLLSLFDGMAQGKKLFVITCNNLNNISDYLVNRPGRFHYHFRFEYPTAQEITQYLQDKVNKEYWGEIDKVVAFAGKTRINYDCLRAITFELNSGEFFENAIQDLNIINCEEENYDICLFFDNGVRLLRKGYSLDLFSEKINRAYLNNTKGEWIADICFENSSAKYDANRGCYIVNAEDIEIAFAEDECAELYRKLNPLYISLKRQGTERLHYAV